MANRIREYHRPEDWDELRRLVYDRKDIQAVEAEQLLISGPDSLNKCDAVIDTGRVLRSYITEKDNYINIGGGTTLQDIAESLPVRQLADGILCDAASSISHLGFRNLATLSSMMFDLNRGISTEIWLALYVLEGFPMFRSDSKLIPEVIVPIRLQRRGGYVRVARTPHDAAIVAACATFEIADGKCANVRLAVSSLDPEIASEIAESAKGKVVSPDLLHTIGDRVMKAVNPVDDFRASAEYRREMAGVLAKRALEMAWKRATQ
jgi:CO/xanthine dehydrogenase FAD-binding subunit